MRLKQEVAGEMALRVTTHAEPRTRESANDVTSGDDDELDAADDVLSVVERARVPVPKQFQEETATDWRVRMQTRLQQLQESAQKRESVAFRVPSGQVVGREYVRAGGAVNCLVGWN